MSFSEVFHLVKYLQGSQFFIHSSFDRNLDCFLTVAVKMLQYTWEWSLFNLVFFFSLDKYPKVELLDHKIINYILKYLVNLHAAFQSGWINLYSQQKCTVFFWLHILTYIYYLWSRAHILHYKLDISQTWVLLTPLNRKAVLKYYPKEELIVKWIANIAHPVPVCRMTSLENLHQFCSSAGL